MHRLFVGVRPPAPVRERLLGLMGGVAGARWQGDDQLHLTLRFIGEVDRHLANDILAALGVVHHPAFEVALAGLGTFEGRRQSGALWVGVTPHDALHALHKKVEQALVRVGLAPERRAFHPHITIARLPRGAGPLQPMMESAGGFSSPPFPVESFCLFESRLTPEGAVYTIVERYLLSGLR